MLGKLFPPPVFEDGPNAIPDGNGAWFQKTDVSQPDRRIPRPSSSPEHRLLILINKVIAFFIDIDLDGFY